MSAGLMAPIIDFRVRRWCRCRLSRQMIGVHARSHMSQLKCFCQDGVGTLVSGQSSFHPCSGGESTGRCPHALVRMRPKRRADSGRAAGGDLLLARLLIWSLGAQRERCCALFQDDNRCAESCGLDWASPRSLVSTHVDVCCSATLRGFTGNVPA